MHSLAQLCVVMLYQQCVYDLSVGLQREECEVQEHDSWWLDLLGVLLVTDALASSLSHSQGHSLGHSLTHTLARSLTQSLAHSLAHSLKTF